MSKIIISESLNELDRKTDNAYDLRSLYESVRHIDGMPQKVAELISGGKDAKSLYEAMISYGNDGSKVKDYKDGFTIIPKFDWTDKGVEAPVGKIVTSIGAAERVKARTEGDTGFQHIIIDLRNQDVALSKENEKLIQSASDRAFRKNVATEVKAGKPQKQALAIAYSIKDKNESVDDENDDVYIDNDDPYEDNWDSHKETWIDWKDRQLRKKGRANWDQDDYEAWAYIENTRAESQYYDESLTEDGEQPDNEQGGGSDGFESLLHKLQKMGSYEQFIKALKGLNADQKQLFMKNFGKVDAIKPQVQEGGIAVTKLIPTQSEIDWKKSLSYGLKQDCSYFFSPPVELGMPVLTYGGKYIIDGHHRWSQVYMFNPKATVQCINFNYEQSGPLNVLKDFQAAVLAQTGNINVGTAGTNIWNVNESELQKFIDENMQDACWKSLVKAGVAKDRESAIKYIIGNAMALKNGVKPISNAPDRVDMPQTTPEVVARAKNSITDMSESIQLNEGHGVIRQSIDEGLFIETVAEPGYEPKKKGIAYKVFKVKNGKLYPPMVANPGGADTPVGVWLKADEGEFAGLSKTGRPQVKSTQSSTLSYRPGWHLGDVPRASQFDRTNKETGEKEFPKDFVWAECEYTMDVDYQKDSDEQGYMRTKPDGTTYRSDKYQHSLAGLPRLPKDGYYKYRTNPRPDTVPWVITGAIKVKKLLDDAEVNEILKSKGIEPIHRQGGDKTLAELGLTQVKESQENIKESKYSSAEKYDLEPRQRTAVDGKTWWVAFDKSTKKYASITDIGKYKTKGECQQAIDKFNADMKTLGESKGDSNVDADFLVAPYTNADVKIDGVEVTPVEHHLVERKDDDFSKPLVYDEKAKETWAGLFDVADPQEVADEFGRDVVSGDKTYYPKKYSNKVPVEVRHIEESNGDNFIGKTVKEYKDNHDGGFFTVWADEPGGGFGHKGSSVYGNNDDLVIKDITKSDTGYDILHIFWNKDIKEANNETKFDELVQMLKKSNDFGREGYRKGLRAGGAFNPEFIKWVTETVPSKYHVRMYTEYNKGWVAENAANWDPETGKELYSVDSGRKIAVEPIDK